MKRNRKTSPMNRNILQIKGITLLGFFLIQCTGAAMAQSTREQVTIIGTFQPSLKEATKITILPELSGRIMQTEPQQLSRVETSVEVKVDPEPINPLQTEVNDTRKLYRNHLNLGAGTNLSPVFDFTHHSDLTKSLALNVQAAHRSAWSKVRDYAPSDWMNNKARISTDINIGEQALQAALNYSFDHFHWYGFKPAEYPAFDGKSNPLLQQFNLFSTQLLWKTRFRDTESVNHHLGLNLDFFNDKHKTFEHIFVLKGGGKKNLSLLPVDGTQYASIDARMQYSAEGDSTMEKSTLFVHAQPAVGLKGSFYSLEAGLGFSAAQAEKTYFNLLPGLRGSLFIFQDRMSLFASFGGKLEHHSRLSLRSDNPFLRSTDSSFMTIVPVEFQTGLSGNPVRGLEIKLAFAHMVAEHMGFFVIDTTSAFNHHYTTVFDDVSRNRFTAELRYETGNNIRAELLLNADQYEMSSLAKPWHMPNIQLSLNGWYPVADKIQATTGILFMGGRYAPAQNGEAKKLKDIIDIRLGAEYHHNQQLWFYATAANLLNQRYFRFDNYPVQGAQLVAGMKLNF